MSQYTCTPAMHGRRHLEFEITYPLDITAGNERYRLDVWFHIPQPLLLWDMANARQYFFTNLLSHTRFKAFELPLRVLADTHDERSPLARISAMAKSGALHQGAGIMRMIYEMRMLVNIFQSQFRGQCFILDNMVSNACHPPTDIAAFTKRLLSEAGKVIAAFHALETDILSAHLPDVIRRNYRWTDESLSLRAEKNFHRIHRILTTARILPQLAELCRDKIAEQIEHRRAHLYETLAQPSDDRIQHIINPYTRRKTGSTRERLTQTTVARTPEAVQRLRHNRQHPYQSLNPPEDVLHYHKEVSFRADALLATEPRLTALSEIIRLDMRHWFYRMDKSDDRIVFVEDNRLRTVKAHRVYHINVILQLTGRQAQGPQTMHRFRVVANRAGIVRIEQIKEGA